jgi:protein-S-isoprenylcysteine O-methyltransferase Ste14
MTALRERIIDFFYQTATGAKRLRLLLTPIFGLVFSLVVLLMILVSFYLDCFFGWPPWISRPYRTVIALPLLTGGALLWLWCAGKFLKTRGTPVPVNPPPRLVTDGPYAYSRNPMMTGLFMVMAGIGIFFGSVTLTFIMTPLFVLASLLEFRYIEEPELARRFGKAYTDYKDKTPIIIPRLGRRRKNQ